MYVRLDRAADGPVRVQVPAPPDFMASFSGSALPFPSEKHAFGASTTTVVATPRGRTVDLPGVSPPNWYYLEGRLSTPRARVWYEVDGVPVHEWARMYGVPRYPGRTLAPARVQYTSTRDMPVRTQEAILLERRACWPALAGAPRATST